MGRCYLFQCSKCGFEARVSGGEDEGLNCFTSTILCRDCKHLYDVATKVRVRPKRSNPSIAGPAAKRKEDIDILLPGHVRISRAAKNRTASLPGGIIRRSPAWVDFRLECPVARHHRIERWKNPGRCPYCRTFLDRTLMPYRIWD